MLRSNDPGMIDFRKTQPAGQMLCLIIGATVCVLVMSFR